MLIQAVPYPPTVPTSAANQAGDLATRPWSGSATGPSAIYSSTHDKTFLAWIAETPPQTAKIAAYDHATGSWSTPIVIDSQPIADDDHGTVALCLLSDGRLVAFYGSHASTSPNQQWSISGVSGGAPVLTSWTRQTALSASKYTYPKPVNIPDGSGGGTLYLFYRKGEQSDSNCPYAVRKATYTSGGALTFGSETVLVNLDGGSGARVYTSAVRLNGSNIEFCATNADLSDTLRQHVYYFRYISSTGAVQNLGNTVSTASGSLPITLSTANASYREVTSSGSNGVGRVEWCRDTNGDLHILYGDGADGSSAFPVKHNVYSSGAWGTAATAFTVKDKGSSTGFVEVWALVPKDSGDEIEVWYPFGDDGSWAERGGDVIRRRRYSSGSWGPPVGILAGDGTNALGHPMAVENADPDLRVVFTEVSQGIDSIDDAFYAKRYAYGDSGFLSWPTLTDSNINQVCLLLGFNGTDAATSTADESSWAHLHPVTFNGNAQLDTAQKKFGTASLLLDGTGDYLTIPRSRTDITDGPEFAIKGDTIEIFFRANAAPATKRLLSNIDAAGTGSGLVLFCNSSSKLQFNWQNSGSNIISLTGTTTLTTGTWYYAAVRRNGTSWELWLNGTMEASGTQSSEITGPDNSLYIGRDPSNSTRDWNGWIDEIRWTKKVQRAVNSTPSAAFPRS